jgi:hypothetical protein
VKKGTAFGIKLNQATKVPQSASTANAKT